MSTPRFRHTFSQRHVVLPVIHVESVDQALRNVAISVACACDGVFLINHHVSHAELLAVHSSVTAAYPGVWVGINSLGSEPLELFEELPPNVQGVWTDHAGVDERSSDQPYARRIAGAIARAHWRGLYFGGVAFKYQRDVDDVAAAARLAAQYMDVVTTSGPGTGRAASVDKLRTMKSAIGASPLAVASGVTPENVRDYLDSVDAFLVATGISRTFTELDPVKVEALVRAVRC
ncbi:MAG: BtpA/SgcQ family protein [Pirellulaceae bacterium]